MLLETEKMAEAECVFAQLEQTAAFLMAKHILMYHSLPDELSTRDFLRKWNGEKKFYLPRVNGVNLEVLPYDRSKLQLGAFRIEEPSGDDVVDADSMELIVVPAVAYDRNGNRVGRGKGYYDRLLGSTRAVKVGVGYGFQLVDGDIDSEPHDVKVDMVITEKGVIFTRHR